MTEELSGRHVLDDSLQGSYNPSVRGEKEKESVWSTQDNCSGEIKTAVQGWKRSTQSLAKGTTKAESYPIKKIAKRKKVAVKTPVKPTPPTSLHLVGRDHLGEPLAAESALSSRRLEKQALI